MKKTTYQIAVLPGDGVGPEVVDATLHVLQAWLKSQSTIAFEFASYDCGAGCFQRTGTDLPEQTLTAARTADAVLLGAMGDPNVRRPDGTELIPQVTLRKKLDLFAGVRPCKLYPGVQSVLAGATPGAVNLVIVREQTEGMFASQDAGIVLHDETAVDSMVMTRMGVQRVCRFAFELANERRRDGRRKPKVTCVDKANIFKSFAFFRRHFDLVATEFPHIETEHTYIDAQALYMVQRPQQFDVIVAENLFGDILSDLAAGLVGGMGMAPSGDIGAKYGVFQPSHGTAPDIAGQGKANPVATILSAAMMLEWLGRKYASPLLGDGAQSIRDAVSRVLEEGRMRTPDIGGSATTTEVGEAVARAV